MTEQSEESKKELELLKDIAEIRERISTSTQEYAREVKNIKKIEKEIEIISKAILKENQKGNNANQELIEYYKEQVKLLQNASNLRREAVKETNKLKLAGIDLAKSVGSKLNQLWPSTMLRNIRSSLAPITELDKALKVSSLQMGLLSKGSAEFRETIVKSVTGTGKLGKATSEIGIGIKELTVLQSSYTESLGRNVMFTEASANAMADLAKGTYLGLEGASEMASNFDKVGFSIERTKDFVEDAMNMSGKQGLNASKVLKNINSGIKLIDRYRFTEGTKGLTKMAQLAARLKIDMNFATAFAEKIMDLEGAVEMSAQLNVLGGEFAKLGDPFRLMYMARNDINGLTEALAKATGASATFNKTTGEFDISSVNMQILRQISQQTGVSMEELVTSARELAKINFIEKEIPFNFTTNKEDEGLKDYITNQAFLKDGKAFISIKGEPKLLSTLTSTDKSLLKAKSDEAATLRDRAILSQNFEDEISNLIINIQSSLLPLVEGINEGLKPFFDSFFGEDNKKFREDMVKLGKQIGEFVYSFASGVSTLGKFLLDNFSPTGLLVSYLGGKALFEAGKWFISGQMLGLGFNSVAGKGGLFNMLPGNKNIKTSSPKYYKGGQFMPGGGRAPKGGVGKGVPVLGKGLLKGAAGGLGGLLGGFAGNYLGDISYEAITGKKSNTGGSIGGTIGSLIGTGLGVFGGPLGMIAGSAIGGFLGSGLGNLIGDFENYGVEDGLFGGSNKSRRAILQEGKITPIDTRDDVLALKKGGAIDKTMNSNQSSSNSGTINFGPIKIDGIIKLVGASGETIKDNIIRDEIFLRDLSKRINEQISVAITGGKLNPNPA